MDIVYLHDYQKAIPVLANWFHQQWGFLHPDRTLGDVINELCEPISKNGLPLIRVLLDTHKPIGTASLVEQDMPDWEEAKSMTPWLASVFVDTHMRQRGFGEQLVRNIESEAETLGYDKLYLFTPDKKHWYQKLGWQTLMDTHYHDEPVTVMCKKLVVKQNSS